MKKAPYDKYLSIIKKIVTMSEKEYTREYKSAVKPRKTKYDKGYFVGRHQQAYMTHRKILDIVAKI